MKEQLNRNRLLIGAAILVVLGGGYYFFAHRGNDKENKAQSVPVSVATVEEKDVPMEVQEVGTVVAYQTVAVRSRLDSQIVEVKFKDGDYVNQGDVLFILDDRTLKAQLGELEANVKRDRAQLENYRQQYERTRNLSKQGFAAAAKLDTDKAAYEAQKASIGASEASLQNTRVQLGYSRITAPISGRTGTINVTVGNNIKANDAQALVTINQIKPIRVQTSLSQTYLDSLRAAMQKGTVEVTAMREGSGEMSKGKLEYIDNKVEPTTGTFEARASFDNEDERLWPGMFVTLQLNLGNQEGAKVVPEVAIQHGQDGDFVFIAENDKALKRPVKVARLQDNQAIISEGLKIGERVIIDGINNLKDESAITITNEKAKDKAEEPAS